ncbi:hypothetical protein COCNU_04G006430 [Cocos nucifera]|uniref:Brix domain-containing protein n=1 Tax=Cocos nucifera TaxID=13894 RepID=A0A8K0I605_COCNU|nr:hypothetical protein COCNU_04G006430 [Cocos nucifera]
MDAINKSDIPNLSSDDAVECNSLVYCSYIALGSYQLVIGEIDSSAPTALQAVKLLALYLVGDKVGFPDTQTEPGAALEMLQSLVGIFDASNVFYECGGRSFGHIFCIQTVQSLEQIEKVFLNQPKVFLCSKKAAKGKKPGKGGIDFGRALGLDSRLPEKPLKDMDSDVEMKIDSEVKKNLNTSYASDGEEIKKFYLFDEKKDDAIELVVTRENQSQPSSGTKRLPSVKRLISRTNILLELKFVFPNSTRMNRGGQVISEIIESCRAHEFTDVILVHEHRGEPDGLIVCHLPFGPTAYFGLLNVVTRHDIKDKKAIGTMSEAYPHLILDNFSTKVLFNFD